MIPQLSFTEFAGFKEPYDVCMPSTNVAESADVIKNTAIRINARIDVTIVSG